MWRTDDDWSDAPHWQVLMAARNGSKGAKRRLFEEALAEAEEIWPLLQTPDEHDPTLDFAVSPGGRPINYSSLDKSPKENWVEKRGGLPPYVRGVARGIARSRGHATPTSRDIAAAIAAMHRWAAGGDDVKPAVQAAAAAAVAQWEKMKRG